MTIFNMLPSSSAEGSHFFGLIVTLLLFGLLGLRELFAHRGKGTSDVFTRLLDVAIIPLFVSFALVIWVGLFTIITNRPS